LFITRAYVGAPISDRGVKEKGEKEINKEKRKRKKYYPKIQPVF